MREQQGWEGRRGEGRALGRGGGTWKNLGEKAYRRWVGRRSGTLISESV